MVDDLIDMARREPVLLVAADGKEFFLSEADDFEREVEALRSSPSFQRFLEERSKGGKTIPLAEIEREIDEEIARGKAGRSPKAP
jgi:hypothetical protein